MIKIEVKLTQKYKLLITTESKLIWKEFVVDICLIINWISIIVNNNEKKKQKVKVSIVGLCENKD